MFGLCFGGGRRGNHTKARAVIGVGQKTAVQSQAEYFALKGVLHHPKHRAIDFTDTTSE